MRLVAKIRGLKVRPLPLLHSLAFSRKLTITLFVIRLHSN
jgi:hypothetical protein